MTSDGQETRKTATASKSVISSMPDLSKWESSVDRDVNLNGSTATSCARSVNKSLLINLESDSLRQKMFVTVTCNVMLVTRRNIITVQHSKAYMKYTGTQQTNRFVKIKLTASAV